VADAVPIEPVSQPDSLVTGKRTGISSARVDPRPSRWLKCQLSQ